MLKARTLPELERELEEITAHLEGFRDSGEMSEWATNRALDLLLSAVANRAASIRAGDFEELEQLDLLTMRG